MKRSRGDQVAIVGAGFSGSVVSRRLADAGYRSIVFESRDHVAGNCFTKRDSNGVMVHEYGPHIFHTADEKVWAYINRFGEMVRYNHQVFAQTEKGGVFSLPITLLTLNQLLRTRLSPVEAEEYLKSVRVDLGRPPRNFREAAIAALGTEIFEVFFEGYTEKQWGRKCEDLPPEIFARLPIRTDYRQSYFNHPYQAIPRNGYTSIVEKILDHPLIELRLSTPVAATDLTGFRHIVWTGPIDDFFKNCYGRLPYRTLDFKRQYHLGDFQGCPVMNFPDRAVPYTRITEHKHFAPWEEHTGTTVFF